MLVFITSMSGSGAEIVALAFVMISAFLVSYAVFPVLIVRLRHSGITGVDRHKPSQPRIPEMGGVGILAGFSVGILLAVAIERFWGTVLQVNLIELFAAFSTILIVTLIGILDDLLRISQGLKAILPIFASLPLVAVKAGKTLMRLPLIGQVDFGIFYSLVLVPLGVTGAANGTNMLAGFNGLEAGLGIAATASLAVIAYTLNATTSLILLLAMLGALLATLRYNWYPAKVFVGDSGTLSIGAVIAAAVIIGNFETAGVLLMIPHFLDFAIKAAHRFPTTDWWGTYRDGKLHCPPSGPVSLCQWIMKVSGGITERGLVFTLVAVEMGLGGLAIWLYAKF
jgi:UDP-N-acetylglucosamine--dolichyl-phosphate N-acetylglucosaminephosphotransferase